MTKLKITETSLRDRDALFGRLIPDSIFKAARQDIMQWKCGEEQHLIPASDT